MKAARSKPQSDLRYIGVAQEMSISTLAGTRRGFDSGFRMTSIVRGLGHLSGECELASVLCAAGRTEELSPKFQRIRKYLPRSKMHIRPITNSSTTYQNANTPHTVGHRRSPYKLTNGRT